MKFQKTLLCLTILASIQAVADDNNEKIPEVTLEEIKIIATNSKIFTTAGAVSEANEEKISRTSGGLDSVVRALPGSFTFMDDRQGTLKVNVRGMTGLGRVNTMIDGVPQTNFGVTATNENGSFHDSQANTPTTSSFGASIDSNFLVGVDVNRGGQGGSHGVNALVGSANFRTIGVNDVLLDDKNVGIRTKYTYGDNKLGHNGMVALAGRHQFDKAGTLGAMLAFSGANKSSDYKRGDKQLASSNAYNPARIQKPRSYLAKIEYDTPNHHFLLSGRQYDINIGGRELGNDSYGFEYRYQPNSDLVNAKFLANTSNNSQVFNKDAKYFLFEKASTTNRANYFDLSNTSVFNLANVQIRSQYGVSFQRNDYTRKAQAVDEDNFNYTTFSPSGKQKIGSLYVNNTFSKDIYDLDLSLSRVKTDFSGYKPACDNVGVIEVPCFPKGEAIIDKTHYNTNGKIQFSAQVHDVFTPFVSYARTSRMPNIQEVFFNNEGGGSMNPFLRPEIADTYEIGFNSFKHGVFGKNDTLGFKALYFNSKIKDYIHSQSFFLKKNGSLTTDSNEADRAGFHAQISVNSPDKVTSKGYEVQASYDTGKYFGNLSYTHESSDQPVNINSGHHDFGFTGGAMDKLPEKYWTLELGSRFFDDKLQLGATLKSYGKNVRVRPDYLDFEAGERLQQMPNNPIVTDLFARYKLNKHATFRFGVENAFDKLYIHPSNSQNNNYAQFNDDGSTSFTNYARGRTITVGADFRF